MTEDQATDTRPWERLQEISQSRDADALRVFVESLPVTEAVRAVSRIDVAQQAEVFSLLSPQQAAAIVGASPESQARAIIGALPPREAAAILHELPSAQVVDIIAGVEEQAVTAILQQMRPDDAADARHLSKYEPDEAGGLMVTEFLSYPERYTAADVLDDMRDNAERYVDFDVQYAYCVSSFGDLVGVLRMRDLVLMPRARRVSDFMIRTPFCVTAHTSLDDLQKVFDERGYLGVPVVDDGGRLVGVVKRTDVTAAISKRSGNSYLKSQGIVMGEELRTMPTRVRASRRLAWLTLNIGLNLIAASAIAIFQGTLEQVIALAVFLPIISDMSGCAGNQAVAVSIRELELGMIKPREIGHVLWKEMQVGLINSLILGLLIAALAVVWKGNGWLGLVAGSALAINTIIAVSVGGLLPLVLKLLKKDPALAAGPILTTVTDMCGFFLALGFATILLSKLT